MNDKKKDIPVRKKSDMNNPWAPAYQKPSQPAHRGDRTSSLGIGLAEGRINPSHEPWFDHMAKTYDMRGRRG
ncbi:hypothetical protein ACSBQT_10750 [Brevibacterium sp. H602]|uniref:Uncharacterized protein n=1 Tax=Brevibacterium sediminis TaxID=1857024 RepID=A0A5C4X2Y2_9MICO|nr:hypothetical protein FHQ09_06530 [Brevibacterium sediminis]